MTTFRLSVVEPPEARAPVTPGAALTLNPACRELRRALGPMTWFVLEDVALVSVADRNGLVAETSARLVGERLGITPGTAAAGLRRLRELGLVVHERQAGPAGRFGLSVYRLHLPEGLVVQRCVDRRGVAAPHAVEPHVADQYVDDRLALAASQLSLLEGIGDGT